MSATNKTFLSTHPHLDAAVRTVLGGDLPAGPVEVLAVTPIERLWEGVTGQAGIFRVFLRVGDREATAVLKRGKVPRQIKKSKAKATKKLRSFVAEASFFGEAQSSSSSLFRVPRCVVLEAAKDGLVDARAASDGTKRRRRAQGHDGEHRAFAFLQEDMRLDFPTHRGALDEAQALRIVDALASFHAAHWGQPPPVGAWNHGSYWTIGKGSCADVGQAGLATRLTSNWEATCRDLESCGAFVQVLKERPSVKDIGRRLAAAACGVHDLVCPPPARKAAPAPAPAPVKEERRTSQRRRKKKRRTGSADEEGDDAPWRPAVDGLVRHLAPEANKDDEDRYAGRTWIHGDAKSENIFLATSSGAVGFIDGQWFGGGLGPSDVAYLIYSSSLAVPTDSAVAWTQEKTRLAKLLWSRYVATCVHLLAPPEAASSAETASLERRRVLVRLAECLDAQFALVVIDFLRYCLEDAALLDEDIALLRHADECLSRIDGGVYLDGGEEAYRQRVETLFGPTKWEGGEG